MEPDRKFNLFIQGFLAVCITVGFFGVIVGLFFVPDVPATTKDILLVMLGALLASYKELTGYFFGSSSGNATKDKALADSSVAKDTALAAAAISRTTGDDTPGSVTIPTQTTITTKEI